LASGQGGEDRHPRLRFREIAAGIALLRAPAVSTNVWNRVFGDLSVADAVALAFALAGIRRKPAVAGGALALDACAARSLDRETGHVFPIGDTRPLLSAAAR